MNKRPGILKFVVVATPVAVVFVFMTTFLWDYMRSSWFAGRAANVQIGDSKDEVLRIMGKPAEKFVDKGGILLDIYSDGDSGDEYWVYGRSFDLENAFFPEPPYFFPIRIRFFGPYADDVYFRFSQEDETVTYVGLPTDAK